MAYRRLVRKEIAAPPAIARVLRLAPDERTAFLQAVGSVREGPLVRIDLYFPLAIGRLVAEEDLESGTPIVYRLEGKLGRRATHAEQLVEPEAADALTARLLRIERGTPVLKITRVYLLGDGQPLEAAVVRYHPERYSLHIELVERPPA
jgi:GntR family transcriptional regulator